MDSQAARSSSSELAGLPDVMVQAGTHLATYFDSEAGRLRIAAPFLHMATLGERLSIPPTWRSKISISCIVAKLVFTHAYHRDVSDLGLVKFVS